MSMPAAQSTSRRPDPFDDVELWVTADLVHLPVIRALATDLARRVGFGADEVADLRVAVDEVCSALMVRAAPGSMLTCLFRVLDEEVRMSAQVASEGSAGRPDHSLGRDVLGLLVDGCATATTRHPNGGFVISTDIVKRSLG
ncbi:MAG: ATP-binding protein [Actinomycetota bacterium]|nr:ATP-binding protein [Actinomycetota bacterium]